MISFRRPMMRMRPASITAWSPVQSQPSARQHARRVFGAFPVALHHQRAAHLQLLVLADAHLYAGQGRPTVAGSLSSGLLEATTGEVSVMP
jgi:hypothetical protein